MAELARVQQVATLSEFLRIQLPGRRCHLMNLIARSASSSSASLEQCRHARRLLFESDAHLGGQPLIFIVRLLIVAQVGVGDDQAGNAEGLEGGLSVAEVGEFSERFDRLAIFLSVLRK